MGDLFADIHKILALVTMWIICLRVQPQIEILSHQIFGVQGR